jgi:hypothetical protein
MAEADAEEILYVRNEGVLWRWFFDGIVVLGDADDRPIVITSPGGRVWSLLAEPSSSDAIAEIIGSEYGVDPARVGPDVLEVISALHRVGAIGVARI